MTRLVVVMIVVCVPLYAWALSEIDEGTLSEVSTPSFLILGNTPPAQEPGAPISHIRSDAAPDSSSPKTTDDPITEKDVSSIIVGEDKAEAPPRSTDLKTKAYSIEHPQGNSYTFSPSYRYTIRSGEIEMRETFIQQRSSDIMPGSWVDIKPR